MSVRIAFISDIHANLPALEAVFNDINARQVDQIYCLGDLVDFAPWGNQVIEIFRERQIPCLLGNHDQRIAFDQAVYPLPHHSDLETQNRILAIDISKSQITNKNKQWLSQLPYQIELTYKVGERLYRLLLVHASPRGNDEYIYESLPENELNYMLDGRKIDALVMGHTHVSYVRRTIPMFINCGSVGRSKESDRKATYCLMTLSETSVTAEIVKIDYPVDLVIQGIRQSPIPDFYADFFLPK